MEVKFAFLISLSGSIILKSLYFIEGYGYVATTPDLPPLTVTTTPNPPLCQSLVHTDGAVVLMALVWGERGTSEATAGRSEGKLAST